MTPLLIAFVLAAGPAQTADSLHTLYEKGQTFGQFLEAARQRADEWHANYRDGAVDAAALARARAVGGVWHFLVVAEDWCRDSLNTVPYLARLVEEVDGLDMRVIRSREGRGVMNAHRTPDGRPATPTIVLLDAEWNDVGCFVERPRAIQDWVMEHRKELDSGEIHKHIRAWYRKDRGASTVSDVVAMLEAAKTGARGGGASCRTHVATPSGPPVPSFTHAH